VSGLTAQGVSVADAPTRALAILDGTMMRQAAMQAYNDAWILLLVCFLCVIPAVFVLGRPKPRGAAGAPVDAH